MDTAKSRHAWLGALLIPWFWAVAPAEAEDVDAALSQAIQLFQKLEWEQSVAELNRLLDSGELSPGQRTFARKTLAEAHMSLGQDEEAVQVYKQIVGDDRTFNMRSLGEEPGARVLMNFSQAQWLVREEERRAYEAQLSQTSRRAALLRSVVLPGWGQRYQGYSKRGYFMLGMTTASIAYATIAEKSFQDAQDAYDRAAEGADFDKLHTDYTEKADRADLALGMVGAMWMLNVIDAASQGPNITGPPSGLGLAPARAGGLQVVYVTRF